jgi:gamma-glutamyltranspeptidase/glutathione hydrolase
VLLSPVSILLSAFGARRVIDGRLRQPGRGLSRPRGFVDGAEIPSAARVAVPANIPAVFVAWGYLTGSPASAFRVASVVARRAGAEARAELLQRAAARGGSALKGSAVERDLVRRAGAVQGGLVSHDDFDPATDVDHALELGAGFPWGPTDTASAESSRHAILAVDPSGGAAVVCYELVEDGMPVCGGELISPLAAHPVRRGIPRVRPGTPLPQRCEGRLELTPDGRIAAAICGALRVAAPS